MRRIGQNIGIKPECIVEYERLHAAVWPEALSTIHACNIRNYSIFRYAQRARTVWPENGPSLVLRTEGDYLVCTVLRSLTRARHTSS